MFLLRWPLDQGPILEPKCPPPVLDVKYTPWAEWVLRWLIDEAGRQRRKGMSGWLNLPMLLAQLRNRQPKTSSEQRVLDLHPTIETIRLSVHELVFGGILVPDFQGTSFHISPIARGKDVLEYVFAVRWDMPWENRMSMSVASGDWLTAQQLIDQHTDPALVQQIAAGAQALRAQRIDYLLRLFHSGQNRGLALLALAEIGAAELANVVDLV